MPVVAGFAVAIGAGRAIGAINGLVTTVARVPSLVVTLAMLYIVRGIDGVIVNGTTIDPGSIPQPSSRSATGAARHPVAGDYRRGRRGGGRLCHAVIPLGP